MLYCVNTINGTRHLNNNYLKLNGHNCHDFVFFEGGKIKLFIRRKTVRKSSSTVKDVWGSKLLSLSNNIALGAYNILEFLCSAWIQQTLETD